MQPLQARPGSGYKRFWPSVLVLFISLLVLVGGELCFRLLLHYKLNFDPEAFRLQHFIWSGQVGYYAGDANPMFHRLGYRIGDGAPFNLIRSGDNEFRILVLGGSSVIGLDEGKGSDWPSLMGLILAAYNRDKKICVLNAGVSGGMSWHERLQAYKFRNYDFDLVIVYTGYNDLYSYFMEPNYAQASEKLFLQKTSVLARLSDDVADHCLSFAWCRYHVGEFRKRHAIYNSIQSQVLSTKLADADRLAQFGRYMDGQVSGLLHELSRERPRPQVLYMLQPFLSDIGHDRPLTTYETEKRDAYVKQLGPQWDQIVRKGMPVLRDSVRRQCASTDVPLVDFKYQLATYIDLFVDDVHMHKNDMLIVGREVAAVVQQKIFNRSVLNWVRYKNKRHVEGQTSVNVFQ